MAEQAGAANNARMDVGVATGVRGFVALHRLHDQGPAGMVSIGVASADGSSDFFLVVRAEEAPRLAWIASLKTNESRTTLDRGPLTSKVGDRIPVMLDWSEPGVVKFRIADGPVSSADISFEATEFQAFVGSSYAEFGLDWLPTDFDVRYQREARESSPR